MAWPKFCLRSWQSPEWHPPKPFPSEGRGVSLVSHLARLFLLFGTLGSLEAIRKQVHLRKASWVRRAEDGGLHEAKAAEHARTSLTSRTFPRAPCQLAPLCKTPRPVYSPLRPSNGMETQALGETEGVGESKTDAAEFSSPEPSYTRCLLQPWALARFLPHIST